MTPEFLFMEFMLSSLMYVSVFRNLLLLVVNGKYAYYKGIKYDLRHYRKL
jgi:hypothetical protein